MQFSVSRCAKINVTLENFSVNDTTLLVWDQFLSFWKSVTLLLRNYSNFLSSFSIVTLLFVIIPSLRTYLSVSILDFNDIVPVCYPKNSEKFVRTEFVVM
jgi:hypothetical protein